MGIRDIRTLNGPNVFADFPVLRMTLELGALSESHSAMWPGFTERLTALLPGLSEHRCSRGRRFGFIERLQEGTYLGHIVEHVALELSTPSGIEVTYGKTVYAGEPGVYHVVVEFENEAAMRYLLEASVDLVTSLIEGRSFDVEPVIARAKRLVAKTALGPSTRALTEAASARGIPWERLNEDSLILLGYGKNRRFLQAATSSRTSFVGVEIAGDKQLTKKLLARAGVPVPRGRIVVSADDAARALEEIGAPVVVKPLDANHGRGVSVNLHTPDEVQQAFTLAEEHGSAVLVERMIAGRNYRILVVGGRAAAASERMPAHVVGDGLHTVRQLVERENENPLRAAGHGSVLTKIEIDDVVKEFFAKTGRSLEDVPAAGEHFLIRESANLSTGGTARDVTDVMHPDTRAACERAARAIDLDICGIDLITDDISLPLEGHGAIIELNAAPGLRMHEHPSAGLPRPVAARIIDWLYPDGSSGRIPILAITGTNGKTTCARLVAHIFGRAGSLVGLTTSDGIYVDGTCIASGDTTGPDSAKMVLSDPRVEVAVLETARGGIVRRGLGYDWSDVGVITNVQCDHLGQDGIETEEDLLRVKSVVAERVREGGTLVLNADDAHLRELPAQSRISKRPKRIVFFSVDAEDAYVKAHVRNGGTAYVLHRDCIVEREGAQERVVVRVSDVPLTLQGGVLFQISNVLAVVAACRAQGVPIAAISQGLCSFDGNMHNRGRMNLFRAGAGYAVVDYGHNPGSYEAWATTTRTWRRPVTAVVSVPGDRDASVHELSGRALAQGFDRIIVKEDSDRRGQEPGYVANLLAKAIHAARPECECLVIEDEACAVRRALETMAEGEVLVIFTDATEQVASILTEHGATYTKLIPPAVDQDSGVHVMPTFASAHQASAYARTGSE